MSRIQASSNQPRATAQSAGDFDWSRAPKISRPADKASAGSESAHAWEVRVGQEVAFVSHCGEPLRSPLYGPASAAELADSQQLPGFDFGHTSNAVGNFVESRAPSPSGRERVSPLIAAFVEQHGLAAHLEAVRGAGRTVLSAEDAQALEATLGTLNVAQRQALREALVPRGSERAATHARSELLSGRPDVSKLLAILQGALS
jgi:hypothetical protein